MMMKIGDKLHALMEIGLKTASGFLPGPASAAFNAVYDNVKSGVLTKRAEKWKEEVVARLEKLESDYDSLVNNESFATALIKTSELAVKTESDEKRKLLADSLINTYIQSTNEDKSMFFLSLVEKYTILHIQIIRYLHDEYMTETFPLRMRPTFIVLFRLKFKDIDHIYLEKVVNDLQNDYIVTAYNKDSPVFVMNKRMELLTKLGEEFYTFLKPTDE